MKNPMRPMCYAMVILPSVLNCGQALAAESGSALYVGGSQAFGAGSTPPPGFYATIGSLYYDGDVGRTIDGGVIDLNAGKTAFVVIGNALYVADFGLLGGKLGVSLSVPFPGYTNIEATTSGVLSGQLSESQWGVGDVSLKIQNGWSHGNFSHTASLTAWLPTGEWGPSFNPNIGKNHAGFDIGWAFTQIWQDTGIELSAAFGYSIELENPTTDYRNGDTIHVDAALGYQFAEGWTGGAAAYAIEQITGDSGSGAFLGDFKRKGYAVGPALSYSTLLGGKATSFSARHYREFGVENSFEGHVSFVTATMRF